MRNIVIGLVIGAVLGIVLGVTVIASRLQRPAPGSGATVQAPVQTPAELAKQLPRAFAPRPDVALKMASAFALETPIAGRLATRLDDRIWDVSRGQIEIQVYPPNALAPAGGLYAAVGAGAIDAAFASPAVAADTIPALQLFAGFPFGPPAGEFLAWLDNGGLRLLETINAEHGVRGIPCGLMPASAFGWFRYELQSPQDLKGLRMQADGLRGLVLAQLGAEVVDLPPGELMLALEQGTVNAVTYASPAVDRQVPFRTWLKNYYPEGWHQSPSMLELMINLKTWETLTAAQRVQIETVCGDNVRHSLAEGEAIQFRAVKDLFAEGVRLAPLPPSIRAALERAWQQLVQQRAVDDPEFRTVWQSLSQFRGDFAIWQDLSSP